MTRSYRITVRVAWWWPWLYVPGIMLAWAITGRSPDMGKVEYWASRAVTLQVRRVPGGRIDA